MRDPYSVMRLLYDLAEADQAYPPFATAFAEKLLGPGCVRPSRPGKMPPGVRSRLVRNDRPRRRGGLWSGSEHWTIEIRRGLWLEAPIRTVVRLVWHEVSEFGATVADHYRGSDLEQYADEISRMARAPGPAIRRVCAEAGGVDYQLLADELFLTELEAVVRVAEELERPSLLLTPEGALYAGPPFEWGEEPSALGLLHQLGALPRGVVSAAIREGLVLRAEP